MSDAEAPRTSAGRSNSRRPAQPPGAAAVSTIPAEARAYQGQRAGIVTRVVANIVDLTVAIVIVLSGYVGWAAVRYLLNPRGFTFPAPPSFVVVVLVVGWVQLVYFALAWMTSGRTYGDHLMGLRVVNSRGTRMRPWTAVLRATFCVFFPIGLFWIVVSPRNRSVQDVALRTSVVYDWTIRRDSSHPAAPGPTT